MAARSIPASTRRELDDPPCTAGRHPSLRTRARLELADGVSAFRPSAGRSRLFPEVPKYKVFAGLEFADVPTRLLKSAPISVMFVGRFMGISGW